MERQAANGYVLTLSLLIAAYVRHLEDEDYEKQQAETSQLSQADRALERKTVARESVSALAQFLLREIQRPADTVLALSLHHAETGERDEATSLHALFQRLQRALAARPEDATVLVDEVLHVLASVDSPDAVSDVVDAIGECVAPLSLEPQGDAANALLVRRSVFGVFVRRFVLAVNRLLFDGLSCVFDEVTRYREEFADRQSALRRSGTEGDNGGDAGTTEGPSDISLSLTASPSTRFLWKQGDDMDDLPLSPIVGSQSTNEPRQFASLSLIENSDDLLNQRVNDSRDSVVGESLAVNEGLSRDQTQYYLHDIVQELEQGLTLTSTSSSRTTVDRVLKPLQKALDPDALFVKYLDAVNRREYESALETLHQYHDVALSRTQRFRHALRARSKAAAAATTGDTANNASSGSGLHFLGSGVQYAALNLAGLHIAFDRFSAAQDAIQEAIRVAQHHGDHICVAFALSWFVRVQLVQGKPRHQVSALIASALERAEELSIPSLRALVSLTALEYDMTLSGAASSLSSSAASSAAAIARFPSPRPLDLWSRLNDVDQILIELSESVGASSLNAGNTGRTLGNLINMQQQQQQQQQGGGSSVRSDGKKTNGMKWKHSIESVLQMMWSLQGKSRAAAAVGWQLYGARALGDTFDNVFWIAYKASASSVEVASWISRMVFARVEWSADEDDEARVQFVGAFRLMRELLRQPELHRHQLLLRDKILQRTIHHVLTLWSLNRAEFALADAHIAQLVALSSASSDMPARIEALVLQSRLYGESGQFARCFELLNGLEKTCRDRGYEYVLAQILVLMSDYLRRSRAPHSPFDALPSVLQAVQICRANRYDLLLSEAHLVIAEIYIAMGKTVDATELLDQQMPLVMEHGSIQLRAESLLVLAKATLAGTTTQPQVGGKLMEWLDDSAALFRRVECWRKLREIAFLKTTILRGTGKEAATGAATEFLRYEQFLCTAQQSQCVRVPVTGVDTVSALDRVVQSRFVNLSP